MIVTSRKYSLLRAFNSLLLVAVIVALGGCVTKGTYNNMVEERDALTTEIERLMTDNASLETQLDRRTADVLVLGEKLQDKREALEQARETYTQIAGQLAIELAAGQIVLEQMKHGVNLRISEDTLFNSGSADLGEGGVAFLEKLAGELREIPYQIVVAGYSDNVPIGPELAKRYSTNWDLAGARATNVVDVLESEGVPSDQLVALSFGQTHPIASNDTDEGRKQNRRIEVRIRPITFAGEPPAVATGPTE